MMTDIIRRIIHQEGPITFARFMELALYHPEGGYYTSGKKIIGKEGDFYTSVHVSPLFGELLAEQVEEMAHILGGPLFQLVEFGAGRGFLALDILRTLQEKNPDLFSRTVYYIIEAGSGLKEKQKKLLGDFAGKVKWVSDLEKVKKPFSGCVLSNELIDAFPVHCVKKCGGQLKEIYVGYDNDHFVEIMGELSNPFLNEYFAFSGVELEEGQRGEVNLAAQDWVRNAGRALDRGFVITVDYGYEAPLLYHPIRKGGTIMCYKEHKSGENPYINVGEQDITAHVNFTALKKWGEDQGLKVTGFTNQMHFLFNLGILEKVQKNPSQALAVQQLVSPEGMGGIFKVLIQHKGMDSPVLKGLTEIVHS